MMFRGSNSDYAVPIEGQREYSSLRAVGIALIILMPLVALTNAWEFLIINGLSIRLLDVLFVMTFILAVSLTIWYQEIRLDAAVFLLCVVLLFLISSLGVLFSSLYSVDWPKLIRFAQVLLWGALPILFGINKKDLSRITASIVAASTLIAISSIFLYIQDPSLHRIAGFFNAAGGGGYEGDPMFNSIGALHSFAILLALRKLFSTSARLRTRYSILSISIGVNILGLLLTNSRSAIVALIFTSFLLVTPVFLNIVDGAGGKTKPVTVGISFVLTTVFLLKYQNVNRLSNTFRSGTSAYESLETRIGLWESAADLLVSRPLHFLVGYGFGSIERFIGAESAHNFFLNVGLWMGILGLSTILYLVGWPMVRLLQRSESGALYIGSIAFCNAAVVSLFGNVFVNPVFGGLTMITLFGAYAAKH